jgi:hypothetical protein
VRHLEDKIINDRSDIPIQNLSLQDSFVLVPRPGYNISGKSVKLWANYFELERKEGVVLYQHSVTIQPTLEISRRYKRRLFSLLLKEAVLAKYGLATNYVDRLICTERLEPISVAVRYYEPEEVGPSQGSPSYNFNIRFDRPFHLDYLQADLEASQEMYQNQATKTEAIQALDMVIAQFPNESPGVQFVGQNRHFRLGQDNSSPLGGGLNAVRGFFHSVRPSTGRLLLNLNVSAAAFYQAGPLHKLAALFDPKNRYYTDPARAVQLDNFLRNLRVRTTHQRDGNRPITKVKTILALAKYGDVAGTPDNIKFNWSQEGGAERNVTVRNYFSNGSSPYG